MPLGTRQLFIAFCVLHTNTLITTALVAQETARVVTDETFQQLLDRTLLDPEQASDQHRLFVLSRIATLEPADSAAAWSARASELRRRVLNEVVFRGVPSSWRQAKPTVVWDEVIETTHGYRIRKLRYEALPGLWIPALLYEPDSVDGAVPAVLNVNGHEPTGKSTPYKQLRCANLAKRGMLALNLEWLRMGQLATDGFGHDHLNKLDLCGRSGLSVFFLAMQRGLDVLLDHPHADKQRTAVTGLSGGGWQTIILSSLDERVRLAVPVAGYSSLTQRVANANSIGDSEQNPVDLAAIADYVHLTAMMVPRPLMMIYNTRDNCCFVASTVKPNTYDPVVPFYSQAGHPDRLAYYENSDPGTHNYELDNRRQFYRFLNQHFFPGIDLPSDEIASEEDVLPHDQLVVPLPDSITDFNTLAAEAAVSLPQRLDGTLEQQRARLAQILRYRPLDVAASDSIAPHAWQDLTVVQLRLQAGDEWTIPTIVVEGKQVERHVILLADDGFASQADRVQELATAGARVVLMDPVLIGQAKPQGELYQNAMLLSTVGERPLGIQSAQLLAVTHFIMRHHDANSLSVESFGPRTSLIARCAAALDGGRMISSVQTQDEPKSLKQFIAPNARYRDAPEAYCFGLLEYFDLPQLIALSGTPQTGPAP